jgi:transposase
VCGEAENGKEAIEKAQELRPDLIVLDLVLEQQIDRLDQEIAKLLRPHEDAVKRLAEVPGMGVDSAQQIIAEVGPTAATFDSAKQLSSWVAVPVTTRARE